MQLTVMTNRGNGWSSQLADVKKLLGQQFENLSRVVADVGRDAGDASSQATSATQEAGTHVVEAARELGSEVGTATSEMGAQAAATAREIPAGAAVLAAGALKGLRQLGGEIRKVRVTREPPVPERGFDARPGIALLAGFCAGLAVMYFLDPEEGLRRRLLLQDKLTKWTRIGRQTAEGTAKDFRNRTVGVMHEARKAVSSRTGTGDDLTELASGNGYGLYENRDAADAEQSPFTEPVGQEQPSGVGM